jgi:hypothetical protein
MQLGAVTFQEFLQATDLFDGQTHQLGSLTHARYWTAQSDFRCHSNALYYVSAFSLCYVLTASANAATENGDTSKRRLRTCMYRCRIA